MSQGRLDSLAAAGGDEAEFALNKKLRSLHFRDKERDVQQKAVRLQLPYFNLEGFPINPESLALLTEDEARGLGTVCFWYSIGDLRVGSINPTSEDVKAKVRELGERHHTTPKLHLISYESLRIALDSYRRVPHRTTKPMGVRLTKEELDRYSDSIGSLQDLATRFEGVSATEAVAIMAAGALKTRSSDIHIEAGEAGVELRYRIDGVLYPVVAIPRELYEKMVSRLKLLSGLKINVTRQPQDGRFTVNLGDDKMDIRLSTLPTAHGESIVMRLLRWSHTGIAFSDLGILDEAKDALEREMRKPNGLILSTGPTGSGKSTTLYAIITALKSDKTKIITLEDPIEYKLAGVNQSQVDPKRGYTFAEGLKSIVRQDPDIIMVGEIRDLDTADIAANAALTGHLVLSTLHTNSAAGAVPRLMSMGLKPYLIPPSVNAIVGQRLVRRICQNCKAVATVTKEVRARIDDALASLPSNAADRVPDTIEFYEGKGCDDCQGLGYKGQIGVFEVLTMSKQIEDVILSEQMSERRMSELAHEQGMVTMLQDGILKALAGITTLDEVFRVTKE